MKQHLILYRNLKYGELLDRMGGLLEQYGGAAQKAAGQKETGQEAGGQETAGQKADGQEAEEAWCAGELIALADAYGFEGNLWLCFLALCLAENENLRDPRGGVRKPKSTGSPRLFRVLAAQPAGFGDSPYEGGMEPGGRLSWAGEEKPSV